MPIYFLKHSDNRVKILLEHTEPFCRHYKLLFSGQGGKHSIKNKKSTIAGIIHFCVIAIFDNDIAQSDFTIGESICVSQEFYMQ